MDITVLGIDLAKDVFQLHGVNGRGQVVLRRRLSRRQLVSFIANLKECLIGMEACAGAHHWARKFKSLGHEVRLMAPEFVKPYVKSNKNDAADAEAICEAVQRPNMRFVPIKTIDQQEVLSLHAVRARLVKARTATINEIRGLLHEFGFLLPATQSRFRAQLLKLVQSPEEGGLSPRMQQLLIALGEELSSLDARIESLDQKIETIHRAHPVCQRIAQIPGIGPKTATALVASMGDPTYYKNGRQVSAWIGLVPKQASSGGKERLMGISKRGNPYLRSLLVQGAMAVLRTVDRRQDAQAQWAAALRQRRGLQKAALAIANKNARVAWALMNSGQDYQVRKLVA